MNGPGITLQTRIIVPLPPPAAFNILAHELSTALHGMGIRFEPGANGRVYLGSYDVGGVVSWEPDTGFSVQWQQTSWEPGESAIVTFHLEPIVAGTLVTIEHQAPARLVDDPGNILGWFSGEIAAPLLRATSPDAFGDWLTDRRARRPSGQQARTVYGDPLYHYPNFRVILEELRLTPDDYLIEVGCGGGVLLRDALKSGCRAVGIDHSVEMVQLACEVNSDAIKAGSLEILEGSADRLPFPDETFTCATMTGVLGFLGDPIGAFSQIHRVLKPRGRLVALGSDPALRGTPAAPEPMASRLRFYNDEELLDLARKAGFTDARLIRRNLEQFAREAGIPEDHLPLFAGPGGPFLLGTR